MSKLDITTLTTEMVNIPSVTRDSNQAIADYVENLLAGLGFEIERQAYVDAQGEAKFNIIGRKGAGEGGLAFFSHMDTVPATGWEDEAWHLKVEPDRLIGLGATPFDPVTQRGEGWWSASVSDPFGNLIGLIQSPHWAAQHA